ncbi:hypothetical protein ACWF94_18220 [Streptomyces sp. NPDC055078]
MTHRRKAQQRRTAYLVTILTTGLLLTGCTAGERSVDKDRYPAWQKGAGAPEAAAFMKVQVPKGATEVKGAVRLQPQERVYLLAFLTDEKTAESIAADLRPDHPLKAEDAFSSLSGDGFKHLGLTPPQDLDSVRSATACPPCVGDERRKHIQGVEIHVSEGAGDRVRVYLTAY